MAVSPKAEHNGEPVHRQQESTSLPHIRVLGRELRKSSLFWILQLGGWLAFGIAMFGWGLSYFSRGDAFVNKALLVVIGFLVTLVFRLIYRIARRRSMPPITSALLVGVVSFVGAAIWRETHTILFEIYYSLTATGQITPRLVAIPL